MLTPLRIGTLCAGLTAAISVTLLVTDSARPTDNNANQTISASADENPPSNSSEETEPAGELLVVADLNGANSSNQEDGTAGSDASADAVTEQGPVDQDSVTGLSDVDGNAAPAEQGKEPAQPVRSSSEGNGGDFQIAGCPTRPTNYIMYASADSFLGSTTQIRAGVSKYKSACMIPNIRLSGHSGSLNKANVKEILDISEELGTYAIIDFAEHFCITENNGETVFKNTHWSQTESQLREFVFSPEIVSHPALVGYYAMDENDKQYGWAGKFSSCGGGTEYIPTLQKYKSFIEAHDKKLFGVTYLCIRYTNSTGCDTGGPNGDQAHVMKFEQDNFVQPYLGHVDAMGYFFYPYSDFGKYGDNMVLYREGVRETARLAEANNLESFFVTQSFAKTGLQEGRWPTQAEFKELRTIAEDSDIQWLGFWSEWISPGAEFDQHWPDIKAAMLED